MNGFVVDLLNGPKDFFLRFPSSDFFKNQMYCIQAKKLSNHTKLVFETQLENTKSDAEINALMRLKLTLE